MIHNGEEGSCAFHTQEDIIQFLKKCTRMLRGELGVEKWLSYMGFRYLGPLEATALAYAARLKHRIVQVEMKDTRQDVRNCFLRVGKERETGLIAKWVRMRVGEELENGLEDNEAADYGEAFLGLAWLEEHLRTPLGWGDMRKVYRFVVSEISALEKDIKRVRVLGEGETGRGGQGGSCYSAGPQSQPVVDERFAATRQQKKEKRTTTRQKKKGTDKNRTKIRRQWFG